MPVRLALVAIAAPRSADNVSTSKLDPELRVGDLAGTGSRCILATSKTKSGGGRATTTTSKRGCAAGALTRQRLSRLSYIVDRLSDLDDMSRLGAAGPCAKEPRDCGQRNNSRNGDGRDVS